MRAKKVLLKKNILYSFLLITVLLIILLQIRKKAKEYSSVIEPSDNSQTTSEYNKLLDQYPVYKDSTYYIYITTISDLTKIVYLKKDSLNDVQRESKFFVHIYPKDSSLLIENQNFLGFDFKNNAVELSLQGKKVYISELILPEIYINKINTGQYGFRANNRINWRIKELLTAQKIKQKLLENNQEEIYQFE